MTLGRSRSGTAKLLIVDASQDTQDALASACRAAGYDVAIAPSGSSAVAMLEWECPDVVMSRAKVDDMDGYDLFTRIRSDPAGTDTAFLLLAGRDRPCALAASEAGVDMVLTGDLSVGMIVTRVAELLQTRGAPPQLVAIGREQPASSPRAEPLWLALERSRTTAAADPPSFQGSLEVMDLAEVTQAIALGGKTGCLVVALSDAEGAMLFEAGRLVHATFAGSTGEDAFGALISRTQREPQASFRFNQAARAELAHVPKTIRRSVDQLLLSIAAGIDEGATGSDHTHAVFTREKDR